MDGDEHRGFGLAVELLHVDAERAVEVEDLRPHRLARGVGDAHAAHAERVLERPVDQQRCPAR